MLNSINDIHNSKIRAKVHTHSFDTVYSKHIPRFTLNFGKLMSNLKNIFVEQTVEGCKQSW